jgi:hypothetical protein
VCTHAGWIAKHGDLFSSDHLERPVADFPGANAADGHVPRAEQRARAFPMVNHFFSASTLAEASRVRDTLNIGAQAAPTSGRPI